MDPLEPDLHPPAQTLKWPELEGLDVVYAQYLLGGRLEVYSRLLRILIQEQFDWPRRMESLLQDGQYESAAREAHRLKGQLGHVGALTLAGALKSLEQALSEGSDPTHSLAACCALLNRLLGDVKAWLDLRDCS